MTQSQKVIFVMNHLRLLNTEGVAILDAICDENLEQSYGGGGTDFRVVFEYIRHEMSDQLPACIVIFSDGIGPYPAEVQALGIPVLWIINNIKTTPPWGRVVRVLPTMPKESFKEY